VARALLRSFQKLGFNVADSSSSICRLLLGRSKMAPDAGEPGFHRSNFFDDFVFHG